MQITETQPTATPAAKIKLMKFYVTDGITKARCWYSKGTLIDGRVCVTIYGRNYTNDLEKIFGERSENGTDITTDYFENSKVRIFEGDSLWVEACARAQK